MVSKIKRSDFLGKVCGDLVADGSILQRLKSLVLIPLRMNELTKERDFKTATFL